MFFDRPLTIHLYNCRGGPFIGHVEKTYNFSDDSDSDGEDGDNNDVEEGAGAGEGSNQHSRRDDEPLQTVFAKGGSEEVEVDVDEVDDDSGSDQLSDD